MQIREKQKAIFQKIRELDPFFAGQIQVEPLTYEHIQSLLTDDKSAIIEFYTSDNDTYVIIIGDQQKPIIHLCKDQSHQELQVWLIKNWTRPYAEIQTIKDKKLRNLKRQQWLEGMPEILKEVADKLEIETIIEQYLTGIEELIIVPHLVLHQIPWSALPIGKTSIKSTGVVGNTRDYRDLGGDDEDDGRIDSSNHDSQSESDDSLYF